MFLIHLSSSFDPKLTRTTHFLCIKDFICWKKPVFPQTFVPLHLVGVTDSFVRFFTHKDTKNQRHLQFFMPYIYLIIRYITKQKRNKKQHFVAPKFAQNQSLKVFFLMQAYNFSCLGLVQLSSSPRVFHHPQKSMFGAFWFRCR